MLKLTLTKINNLAHLQSWRPHFQRARASRTPISVRTSRAPRAWDWSPVQVLVISWATQADLPHIS